MRGDNTPEQYARDLLELMEMVRLDHNGRGGEYEPSWTEPRDLSAGDVGELAGLIAERNRLRVLLGQACDALHECGGQWGPDAWEAARRIRKVMQP